MPAGGLLTTSAATRQARSILAPMASHAKTRKDGPAGLPPSMSAIKRRIARISTVWASESGRLPFKPDLSCPTAKPARQVCVPATLLIATTATILPTHSNLSPQSNHPAKSRVNWSFSATARNSLSDSRLGCWASVSANSTNLLRPVPPRHPHDHRPSQPPQAPKLRRRPLRRRNRPIKAGRRAIIVAGNAREHVKIFSKQRAAFIYE